MIQPALRTTLVEEYYFSRKLQEIDKMKKAGCQVINLGIGSPDLMPSEKTIRTLCVESQRPGQHGYQSYRGSVQLREAFSKWYSKYFKVEIDSVSEILPLMGSKEGIMHISMAFLNPGDYALVPNPGYPTYTSATRLVGAEVKYYNLSEETHWAPDFTQIEKSDLTGVKIMWVNYPHMPTGAKATPELMKKLVEFGEKHKILICCDNPYSFILNANPLSILSVPNAKRVALELNSLSKSHNMAGWRIGMVAGNADYIQSILKVKSNMDSGMYLPLQLAAAEALQADESWFTELNAIYSLRRKIVFKMFDCLGCKYSEEQVGLFAWGRITDEQISSESLSEKILKETHVFLTPGFIFGSQGERYIRIALCADEKILNEALMRIEKFRGVK